MPAELLSGLPGDPRQPSKPPRPFPPLRLLSGQRWKARSIPIDSTPLRTTATCDGWLSYVSASTSPAGWHRPAIPPRSLPSPFTSDQGEGYPAFARLSSTFLCQAPYAVPRFSPALTPTRTFLPLTVAYHASLLRNHGFCERVPHA